MSEYQYYEFVAMDRPLPAAQQDELRTVSSRGEISPTSFVNEYEWGDLKADPREWMERYFDAHLYLANWSTHRIALRLPRTVLDPAVAERYCGGDTASSWATPTHVIVDLYSEDEDGDQGWVDPDGRLATIAPVRAVLAEGDLRPLYVAWLLVVQSRALDEDAPEPAVPAGLSKLSGAQRALADFLRLDPDLLATAAEAIESGTTRGRLGDGGRTTAASVRTRDGLPLRRRPGLAAVHRALVGDEARNTQIVNDVAAALERGRNCLVLTRRIAHLELLVALLAERGHKALVLQGGMPVLERRATVSRVAEAKPGDGVLVVGTTPFIGEGFDAPALDTLFLAGPISFDGLLIQCAGRVVRAAPGKDVAEVHDYHDRAVPIVAASLQRRMPGYRALGFLQM